MATRKKRRPSSPPSYAFTPRHALLDAGGVAGAHYIAAWLEERLGAPVKVRQVRDRLKNYGDGIERLGAGYYALAEKAALPVDIWATRWLALQPQPPHVADLVQAVLEAYPHGDPTAVRCWVHQQVGALRVREDRVWLVSQLQRPVRLAQ